MKTVTDMGILRSMMTLRPAYDATLDWASMVKATVARFARGNISAQMGRILMPDRQKQERVETRPIAERWRAKRRKIAERTAAKDNAAK